MAPRGRFLRRREDGDGLRAELAQRRNVGGDLGARGGRDSHDDPVAGELARSAPAEHRFVRRPGRQPVDLGAHDAGEKFRGALRQFERAEQERVRRATRVQAGCRAGSRRAAPAAARPRVRRRCARRSVGRPRASTANWSPFFLDQPDIARRHDAAKRRHDDRPPRSPASMKPLRSSVSSSSGHCATAAAYSKALGRRSIELVAPG